MARFAATERETASAPPAFRILIKSFRRHLLAENRASRTIQNYCESLNCFSAFKEGARAHPRASA
jgi:hypothetical protein